jgi:hypothetical protein
MHFSSLLLLSLAMVKRFSGVPGLKFGASHGEGVRFQILELTLRCFFKYFGLTTTVHPRAPPTGLAKFLKRHFKKGVA